MHSRKGSASHAAHVQASSTTEHFYASSRWLQAGPAIALSTPTLLLFGADDGVVRPHQLHGYEEHAEDMRVELIPGVGHFTAEEAPGLVVDRAIKHFDPAASSASGASQSRSPEERSGS
jgi:pimeloyl-ACP methyl ester carboxylesterase